jgi:hypothetical protein
MKVYITQYALTKGILEAEVRATHCPTMVVRTDTMYQTAYHKPYWHMTMAEAVVHAEQMRQRKIVSVKKQLAKLEALTFQEKK